jgi:hypothetical protein
MEKKGSSLASGHFPEEEQGKCESKKWALPNGAVLELRALSVRHIGDKCRGRTTRTQRQHGRKQGVTNRETRGSDNRSFVVH